MKDGYIQQVGEPKNIYDNPANVFVAGFIGTPPMNFIEGTVDKNGHFTTSANDCDIIVPEAKLQALNENSLIGKKVLLGIRPEHIFDSEDAFAKFGDATVDVTVEIAELLGASTNIYTKIGGFDVVAVVPPRSDIKMNQQMKLCIDMSKCHFFDIESEKCLTAEL